MPKLTPIRIGVEEEATGRVMRLLHTMPGVATVEIAFEEKVKPNGAGEPRGPYKPRKTPIVSEVTGEEVIAKALFLKPLTTGQLRDEFVAFGRSPKSINSVIHVMKKNGEIKKDEGGNWLLTKKMRDRIRHRKTQKGGK